MKKKKLQIKEGELLRQFLKKHKINQNAIAAKLEITATAFWHWLQKDKFTKAQILRLKELPELKKFDLLQNNDLEILNAKIDVLDSKMDLILQLLKKK